MANKKTKPAQDTTDSLGALDPAERANEADKRSLVAHHVTAIETLYGDGEDYNVERSVAKVQSHLGSSAEHFLHAGRELIRLKEHEERGQFLFILEHRLGIAPRAAQKMMQAAAKFLTSDGKVRPLLADLNAGSGKVIELLTLDDDDLEAIEAGERVAGVTVDDIANMSVTELRKALRAAREEQAASDELVGKKEERISKLERDLGKARRGGVEFSDHAYNETLGEARALAEAAVQDAEKAFAVLTDAVEALRKVEVPAHLQDIAKRGAALTVHASTLQLAELLARCVQQQEDCFVNFLADAKAQLPTLADA